MGNFKTCSEVGPGCPVSDTTYGYYPTLWANASLCVVFGLTGLFQIVFGIYFRTWTWAATLSFGCLLEFAGYLARIYMHDNPWNSSAYKIQIVAIIIAPSFIAAGINLTLKHVVLAVEPRLSRIRPSLYTWIFVPVDFGCIVLQAIGGGMAASARSSGSDKKLLNTGNDIIVAGIALQVANLLIFGLVGGEYAVRLWHHRHTLGSTLEDMKDRRFRAFLVAVTLSYVTILIRSIYRIPEMADGWGSSRQRNETEFLALDGLMVAIAAVALTFVHPGWAFPALSNMIRQTSRRQDEKDVELVEDREEKRFTFG